MFEIGFSEIVLIAIVALLVVGPQEFPALVRNIGSWLGKARRFMSSVKSEFDREINKAEEIKRMIAKEVEIAELHETLDPHRRADSPAAPIHNDKAPVADAGAPTAPVTSESAPPPAAAKQDHGTTQT
jgi:sec-independent protein translocase protein TatB